MTDRKYFAEKISHLDLSRVEQAIAFLWLYRYTQTYEERTASELASDLADEGLGRPNVTELRKDLIKNRKTIKGQRPKTFQIHTKYLAELNAKYETFVTHKTIKETSSVVPIEFVHGTRAYLESMVKQINGAYDVGFFDCCAVLIRRLMESLIIEVFIYKQIANQVKINNTFLPLEQLIIKITNHGQIHLGRNASDIMEKIKRLGDVAAHDRTYITRKPDIDDVKSDIRKIVHELLINANIKPKSTS